MSASVRVWSDTLGADESALADALDPEPGYRAELPVFGGEYRAEIPIFGDDPDEQRSVLQAAVLCACAGAGLWGLLFGLIALVTP